MPVQRPSAEELSGIAERFSFTLDADQQAAYGALLEAGVFPGYDALAELESPAPEVRWPRGQGRRPDGRGGELRRQGGDARRRSAG